MQTCVHDIYKVFNPNISEKKELRLTRVFAVILPLGALVIALYIKNAYSILMFAWSFYAAAAGLPAFAALYWKKATKAGIIAGMAAGFTVCVGWKPEITLREMVSEMVANDLEAAKKHSLLKSHGYDVAIALES